MKRLIVTGDDFGLAIPVNEAIEEAHRRGILTTASLMVGAGATSEAVERAQRLPSLKVGLHLVLVKGRPVLPHQAIPDLVDKKGELSFHLVRAGINFFFRPGIRQQLEREVRAQFERMGAELVHRILRHLPAGVTEIYFHPATHRCPEIDRTMEDYHTRAELDALTSPTIRQALLSLRVKTIAFSDL